MKKQTAVIDDELYQGSGNIFQDLELPDAAEHDLKALIAIQLNAAISARNTSQANIARQLGIRQPHVSQLMHYKLQGFSIERLMLFLVRLGHPLRILISGTPCRDADIAVLTTGGRPIAAAANDVGNVEVFSACWQASRHGGKRSAGTRAPLEVDDPMSHRDVERHVTFASASRSLQ